VAVAVAVSSAVVCQGKQVPLVRGLTFSTKMRGCGMVTGVLLKQTTVEIRASGRPRAAGASAMVPGVNEGGWLVRFGDACDARCSDYKMSTVRKWIEKAVDWSVEQLADSDEDEPEALAEQTAPAAAAGACDTPCPLDQQAQQPEEEEDGAGAALMGDSSGSFASLFESLTGAKYTSRRDRPFSGLFRGACARCGSYSHATSHCPLKAGGVSDRQLAELAREKAAREEAGSSLAILKEVILDSVRAGAAAAAEEADDTSGAGGSGSGGGQGMGPQLREAERALVLPSPVADCKAFVRQLPAAKDERFLSAMAQLLEEGAIFCRPRDRAAAAPTAGNGGSAPLVADAPPQWLIGIPDARLAAQEAAWGALDARRLAAARVGTAAMKARVLAFLEEALLRPFPRPCPLVERANAFTAQYRCAPGGGRPWAGGVAAEKTPHVGSPTAFRCSALLAWVCSGGDGSVSPQDQELFEAAVTELVADGKLECEWRLNVTTSSQRSIALATEMKAAGICEVGDLVQSGSKALLVLSLPPARQEAFVAQGWAAILRFVAAEIETAVTAQGGQPASLHSLHGLLCSSVAAKHQRLQARRAPNANAATATNTAGGGGSDDDGDDRAAHGPDATLHRVFHCLHTFSLRADLSLPIEQRRQSASADKHFFLREATLAIFGCGLLKACVHVEGLVGGGAVPVGELKQIFPHLFAAHAPGGSERGELAVAEALAANDMEEAAAGAALLAAAGGAGAAGAAGATGAASGGSTLRLAPSVVCVALNAVPRTKESTATGDKPKRPLVSVPTPACPPPMCAAFPADHTTLLLFLTKTHSRVHASRRRTCTSPAPCAPR
jgi:hypothetical protein